MRQYSESTKAIVRSATALAERLKALGWTRQDCAAALFHQEPGDKRLIVDMVEQGYTDAQILDAVGMQRIDGHSFDLEGARR